MQFVIRNLCALRMSHQVHLLHVCVCVCWCMCIYAYNVHINDWAESYIKYKYKKTQQQLANIVWISYQWLKCILCGYMTFVLMRVPFLSPYAKPNSKYIYILHRTWVVTFILSYRYIDFDDYNTIIVFRKCGYSIVVYTLKCAGCLDSFISNLARVS